jgi:hypothetical protein
MLGVALIGNAFTLRNSAARQRRIIGILAIFAIAAMSSIWVVALDSSTFQARIGFAALPALGCLAAIGLERMSVPVALRFAGPMLGTAGTVIAIRRDVVDLFINQQ